MFPCNTATSCHENCLEGTRSAELDMVQFAIGKILLPDNIAEAISGLSSVVRVSLRAMTFFLEVILEAIKLETRFGMGFTRRALANVVGAASTV